MPLAYPGRSDYRLLIASGTLVAASVVSGQLARDNTVVLLGIELDVLWPDDAST